MQVYNLRRDFSLQLRARRQWLSVSRFHRLTAFSRRGPRRQLQSGRDLLKQHLPSMDSRRVHKEDQEYWEEAAAKLNTPHPSAQEFLKGMDLRYPFGITQAMLDANPKPKLFNNFLKYKEEHPRKVIIVKIGEFYEAIGLDAVFLMSLCGLNPMGKSGIAGAGFPRGNITETICTRLVSIGGMAAAVYEESQAAGGGRSKGPLERHKGGVITPARPFYVHGMVDAEGDLTRGLDASCPILGVASSVSGYKVIEANIDRLSYTIYEGLTDDSVSARLHRGGLAPPLYVHQREANGPHQLTEATPQREWELRIKQLFQAGAVQYFQANDPVKGFLDLIIRENGLPADAHFTPQIPDPEDRPKALFNCTASQLGIHRTHGIPSLLDAVLAPNVSKVERAYMRRLLLHPPPAHVAASIRKACSMLRVLRVSLPKWVVIDSSHVARFINAREAPVNVFRELQAMLSGVQRALEHREIQPLASALIPAVVQETGLSFRPDSLLEACRALGQSIDAVIEAADGESMLPEDQTGEEMEALQELFISCETFRGKIKPSLIEQQLQEVVLARGRVEAALRAAFGPISLLNDLSKNAPKLHHDALNNAVWIKVTKHTKGAKKMEDLTREGDLKFIVPIDRNGKSTKLTDMRSTEQIEDALVKYREACANATEEVRFQLRSLAARLEESMNDLVGATVFSMVAATLETHVREALQRGWELPTQLHMGDSRQAMSVTGMWPYWLDGQKPDTVRNDLDLQAMVILTGPNMAGKSTIMRSMCAVAVLAACGLHAPVAVATVPYTDAFMLRTFSMDSPLEGQSSFAVEMCEVRHVVNDVSEHSLVLVDELGKGTEPRAGTCIAASFVDSLAATGCRGMFATHLHELLDLEELRQGSVQYMRMETVLPSTAESAPVGSTDRGMSGIRELAIRMGERVPTLRIMPGACRYSLAFLVMARELGEGHPIVQRALQLRKQGRNLSTTPALENLELNLNSLDLDGQSQERAHPEEECPAASNTVMSKVCSKRITDAQTVLAETASHVFTQLAGENAAATETTSCAWSTGHVPDCSELTADLESSSETLDSIARNMPDVQVGVPRDARVGQPRAANARRSPCLGVQVVRRDEVPPPSTKGRSCVYIVIRPDGKFYAGETDDIKSGSPL